MKPLHTRVEAQQLDRAAAMLKVLSHPKRLAIVDLLGKTKGKDSQMGVASSEDLLHWNEVLDHPVVASRPGTFDSQVVGSWAGTSVAESTATPHRCCSSTSGR